jgi:hypothetical protein
MIKTFRGLVAHGGQDTVVLHTNDGSIGYRILKLETIDKDPGTNTMENVLKIYKVSQTAVSGTIDFSDQTLLAAAYFENNTSGTYGSWKVIIFDSEIFNQDIYITSNDSSGNANPMNYYIELEQVKLSLDENTVATLKDIRNVTAPA